MSQPAPPGAARAPGASQPRHPRLTRNTGHRPAGGSPQPARTPQQPVTAASPAAATGPMPTRSAATAARPQISARLPVGDRQIQWRRQPDGRTVLEVADQAGNLTGLVATTRLPIISVDGARRGTGRGPTAAGSGGGWPSATPAP
jgi:hypothetical protein